jgi:hypothetical protein
MPKKKAKTSAPRPSATKPTKTATKPTAQRDGKLSILDAAVRVLKESGESMNCKAMIENMLAAKYWRTNGKTPAATLSSALLREITTKGKESRFRKTERGQFSLV